MAFDLDPAEISSDSLLTLHDKRVITSFQPYIETYIIPASGTVLLREAPQKLSNTIPTGVTIVEQNTAVPFIETFSSTPSTYHFSVDYITGIITFFTGDVGKKAVISYNGIGSVIDAAHINNIITPLAPFYAKLNGIVPDIPATQTFTFPGDVTVTGTLNVSVINETVTEILKTTDDILLLNSGSAAPTSSYLGIEVQRVFPYAANKDPQLVWYEAVGNYSWQFLSTDDVFPDKTTLFKVRNAGGVQLQTIDSTTTPNETAFVSSLGPTDAGVMWFNVVDGQFKGFNGTAIVILG